MNVKSTLFRICRNLPSDYLAALSSHLVAHKSLSFFVGQRTFSERIAFRKFKPHPIYGPLTDKYAVRDFVNRRIGPSYLVPVYAVTDSIEEFDFTSLPSQYVMKATHGCGWVKLVMNSDEVDPSAMRALAQSWLESCWYPVARERHYLAIKPRVLFEKLLLQNGSPTRDFKVHCFRKGGKLTQIIQVHTGRFNGHKVNFFTPEWIPIDLSHGIDRLSHHALPKPEQLLELLQVADRLSRNINYVRVDLYISSNRVYFGELTFTPAAGLRRFYPRHLDRQWADLFDKHSYAN